MTVDGKQDAVATADLDGSHRMTVEGPAAGAWMRRLLAGAAEKPAGFRPPAVDWRGRKEHPFGGKGPHLPDSEN